MTGWSGINSLTKGCDNNGKGKTFCNTVTFMAGANLC